MIQLAKAPVSPCDELIAMRQDRIVALFQLIEHVTALDIDKGLNIATEMMRGQLHCSVFSRCGMSRSGFT